MKAITQGPGCYWKTDDAAGLSFNEVDHDEGPPTHVTCLTMGGSLHRPGSVSVPLDSMVFLAAGLFGAGRPCGFDSQTKWSGNSHKYAVYEVHRGVGGKAIVVLVAHGGGMRGYHFDQTWSLDMWRGFCKLKTESLWDVCHAFTDAYEAGRDATKVKLLTAFLEGRLKKRKKGGRLTAEVIDREIKEAAL